MRGGGQRPFGIFPKIHPIWQRDPSLMMILMMMVIRSQVGVGCQQLGASRSQSIRKKEVSAIDQHNDNDQDNSGDNAHCDHLDHHDLNQSGRRGSLQLISTMIMIKMILLIIIILMVMIIQVQSNEYSQYFQSLEDFLSYGHFQSYI